MRILITAGPTREPIDPVRFLSNRSSGKMGYAIAEAAVAAGLDTVLISGPVALHAPDGVRVVNVVTCDEMFAAVEREIVDADLFVMCAAVADYKPKQVAAQKVKKREAAWILELEPTRDILATARRGDRVKLVAGFAAETESLREHAVEKLRRKRCDLLVANDVSRMDAGFESDYNAVTIFFRDGAIREIARASKREIAEALVKILVCLQENY